MFLIVRWVKLVKLTLFKSLISFNALSSSGGSQVQKNSLLMNTQKVNVCVHGQQAACLFVWPEPCSLLTACKGSQGPAVCGLPGSTDETSICLSLKRWSVNMTWSNNYYTFWQLCAYGYTSVCVSCYVYLCICPRLLCNKSVFARTTSRLMWNHPF